MTSPFKISAKSAAPAAPAIENSAFASSLQQQTTQPKKKKAKKKAVRRTGSSRNTTSSQPSIGQLRQQDEQRLRPRQGVGELRQFERDNPLPVTSTGDVRANDDKRIRFEGQIDGNIRQSFNGKMPATLSPEAVDRLVNDHGTAYLVGRSSMTPEQNIVDGKNLGTSYYINIDSYKSIVLERLMSR